MAELMDELRQLVVSALKLPRTPESISPGTRLFGGELGLDSVDAVGFVLAVEKRFSIEITDGDLARFPLTTLRDVAALLGAKGVPSDPWPGGQDTGRLCGCRTKGLPGNDGKLG
jgi:acyl carrier protein